MFRVYFAFYKHFRLSMSELVCQLSQRTVHVVVLVPTPSPVSISAFHSPITQHYVHFPRKAAK